jgi:putative addiction module component (TIGR02574 family)
MAMKADDLLREALALSHSERAGLAADLLASLDEPDDDPELVAAEWAEELRRRVDAIEAGTSSSEPWETVRERLLAKFPPR